MVPSSSAASLAELYARCVQMANENKISARNAFDLHLIDHMDAIVKSFLAGGGKPKAGGASSSSDGRGRVPVESQTAEGGFHEVSCTIEASARIYGCRVDHVHINTYRVLGGLGGRAAGEEEEEEEGRDAETEPNSKRRRIVGVNTLERSEANITQRFGEVDGQSDPVFLNMAAAFDAGGAQGLLLATLPVAEDLSLVFNGDVPLNRAAEVAEPMFEHAAEAPVERLGLGEPSAARADLVATRLSPLDLDGLRRELWGDAGGDVSLPSELEALLAPRVHAAPRPAAAADRSPPLGVGRAASPLAASAIDRSPFAGSCAPDLELAAAAPDLELDAAPDLELDFAAPPEDELGGQPQLPLACAGGSEDIVPFDELFQTFCEGSGPHQFADFDRCWAKLPSESWARRAKEGERCVLALADVERTPEKKKKKKRPEVEEEEKKKRPPAKRSIFDLDDLDAPVEPLEMEPVHKHQLGEQAALEQLHRDVPPYMIDSITLPTWRPSTYDFARLGLRPHLMLKFQRKEPPEGEGPHGFFDLFAAEVAENPEAPAWLAGADAARAGEGARAGEDDLDAPPDLDFADSQDPLGMPGLDFDLSQQSQPVKSADLPYSRSAMFVDVKLVKKHLWDCISEDDAAAKELPEPKRVASSFQGLVDRAVERLPEAATENLSAAVCFICALHLCNERGLELETDESRPLGDFNVVGPPRGRGGPGE